MKWNKLRLCRDAWITVVLMGYQRYVNIAQLTKQDDRRYCDCWHRYVVQIL
jgi:hypothetical protein